jgi:hypothetical protein
VGLRVRGEGDGRGGDSSGRDSRKDKGLVEGLGGKGSAGAGLARGGSRKEQGLQGATVLLHMDNVGEETG